MPINIESIDYQKLKYYQSYVFKRELFNQYQNLIKNTLIQKNNPKFDEYLQKLINVKYVYYYSIIEKIYENLIRCFYNNLSKYGLTAHEFKNFQFAMTGLLKQLESIQPTNLKTLIDQWQTKYINTIQLNQYLIKFGMYLSLHPENKLETLTKANLKQIKKIKLKSKSDTLTQLNDFLYATKKLQLELIIEINEWYQKTSFKNSPYQIKYKKI